MNLCPEIERLISSCFQGDAFFDESALRHTSFKIGGPLDVYLKPSAECFADFAPRLFFAAQKERIPLFTLGGGSNLLVADGGIRGITLDTGGFAGVERVEERGGAAFITFRAGTLTNDAVQWARDAGFSGLEDFAGLPGTLGGAVWMNARSFESDIAGVLASVAFFDDAFLPQNLSTTQNFSYKHSPFQGTRALILSATLRLTSGDKSLISEKTAARLAARELKGHFRYPSAGSVWKNNRAYGKSSGQIVEEAHLCGAEEGGAQIAPWHGNFIINRGGATAQDVLRLMERAENAVRGKTGFSLEREIIVL